MSSRDDLLQPSLQESKTSLAPPSTQVLFLTAFFGGPAAAVAAIAIGSQRLNRLGRDWPILLALLAVPIAALAWVQLAPSAAALRMWLTESFGASDFRLIYRVMALICFAVGYWLHREAHRNSDLLGLKRPNGWWVGIPCIVFGYLFMIALLMLIEQTGTTAQ